MMNTSAVKISLLFSFCLFSVHMLVTNEAHANIYKCVNGDGVVVYNDKPCPKDEKQEQLKNIKDPEGSDDNRQVETVAPDANKEPVDANELSQLRNQQRYDYIKKKKQKEQQQQQVLPDGDPLDMLPPNELETAQ